MSTLLEKLRDPQIEITLRDLDSPESNEKEVNEILIIRALQDIFKSKDKKGLRILEELIRTYVKNNIESKEPLDEEGLKSGAHFYIDTLAQYADRFLKAGYEASGFLEIGPSIEARGPVTKFCRDVLNYHPNRES